MKAQNYPSRKLPRLKEYDYSAYGCYFVTICTFGRRHILSNISDITEDGRFHNTMTPIGTIVEQELLKLPERYPEAILEKYVIMPNHLHALISIQPHPGEKAHSISDMMCAFKSITAKECKKRFATETLFQKSFYDRIIRDQKDFSAYWLYIDANPQNWKKDDLFPAE